MNRKFLILGGFVLFVWIVILIGEFFIKEKIKVTLEQNLPPHSNINDYNIHLSLLQRKLTFENLEIVFYSKEINPDTLQLKKLELSGIGYFKLLFSDKIVINSLNLEGVNWTNYQRSIANPKPKKINLEKEIEVKKLVFKDLNLNFLDSLGQTLTKINDLSMEMDGLFTDESWLKRPIPFKYQTVNMVTGRVEAPLNPYDVFSFEKLQLFHDQLEIHNLSIETQGAKEELSFHIETERDHTDLKIPILTISGFEFGTSDSLFFVTNKKITINNPVLQVYRDKTVEDDLRVKPLYSKAIRELPFLLTTDSVLVKEASITYEEKMQPDHPAGKLFFKNLNATITDLSNTYESGEKVTVIRVTSDFLNSSQLETVWEFDTTNLLDDFSFAGQVTGLNASDINRFSQPNIGLNFEGHIKKVYFNISGNHLNSSVDFRINYDEFSVYWVTDKKRNKLLSALTNILVKQDSDTNSGYFREGKATVQRNLNKSFFNYLWINLEGGLKETMTIL